MNIIRKKRREIDITQTKLGEMVGYTGHTAKVMVSTWESGRQAVPRAKILLVSQILDIPVEDFLKEEKQK